MQTTVDENFFLPHKCWKLQTFLISAGIFYYAHIWSKRYSRTNSFESVYSMFLIQKLFETLARKRVSSDFVLLFLRALFIGVLQVCCKKIPSEQLKWFLRFTSTFSTIVSVYNGWNLNLSRQYQIFKRWYRRFWTEVDF